MPCRGPSDSEYLDDARKEIDVLTKLLCGQGKIRFGLLTGTELLDVEAAFNEWYSKHREKDKQRALEGVRAQKREMTFLLRGHPELYPKWKTLENKELALKESDPLLTDLY